jgi:hypothetical protein
MTQKLKASDLVVISREDLNGLDELLSWYEDFEHGELGKRIIYLRSRISTSKPLTEVISDAWDAAVNYESDACLKEDHGIKITEPDKETFINTHLFEL